MNPRQFLKWHLRWMLTLTAPAAVVAAPLAAAESSVTNAAFHTLDSLVADALEKNPELKFYEVEIIAARTGRKSAGCSPTPN